MRPARRAQTQLRATRKRKFPSQRRTSRGERRRRGANFGHGRAVRATTTTKPDIATGIHPDEALDRSGSRDNLTEVEH